MNEYDTYKYTCCAGHRCASHVVTYDPPCARDNGKTIHDCLIRINFIWFDLIHWLVV